MARELLGVAAACSLSTLVACSGTAGPPPGSPPGESAPPAAPAAPEYEDRASFDAAVLKEFALSNKFDSSAASLMPSRDAIDVVTAPLRACQHRWEHLDRIGTGLEARGLGRAQTGRPDGRCRTWSRTTPGAAFVSTHPDVATEVPQGSRVLDVVRVCVFSKFVDDLCDVSYEGYAVRVLIVDEPDPQLLPGGPQNELSNEVLRVLTDALPKK